MKKLFSMLTVLLLAFVLVSCTTKQYEVAMITDTGDIDDGSFNQGTWEGIKRYAKDNKVSHKYYKPGGETVSDYTTAIDLAVKNGAKIVITPGFYFEAPILEAQDKYPDVKFVLLDGTPNNGDFDGTYVEKIGDNTLSIMFKEEQAGFLAGYSTYKEGYKKLGYMGGIAVPAVVRFGIGWVAGAYYAAKEAGDMTYKYNADRYVYLGSFGPNDQFKNQAAGWYANDVDVIHAAAGGAGFSVMAAAEELTNKWVVGVDSDQADDSETVLTSAFKAVGQAAYLALGDFYADKFPGGKQWNLGVEDDAADIPFETSRFTKFTKADHTAIRNKIITKEVVVPVDVPFDAEVQPLINFIRELGFTLTEAEATALLNSVNDRK